MLPSTAHLTITPVTERVVDDLVVAATAAADAVRGMPHLDGTALAAGLLGELDLVGPIDSNTAFAVLGAAGLLDPSGLGPLAPVLALVEALPPVLVERLLIELLAAGLER
jgi:hypothetical protein